MIALSSQKRMTEFLIDVALPNHGIDIFDNDLAEKLKNRINWILNSRVMIKACYSEITNRMRTRTKIFNEKIYNFIKEA